jgi:hypothetical protein
VVNGMNMVYVRVRSIATNSSLTVHFAHLSTISAHENLHCHLTTRASKFFYLSQPFNHQNKHPMKNLFSLFLILFSIACGAQTITLSDVGLPPELSVYQNAVITSKQVNLVTFTPVTNRTTGERTVRASFTKQSPGFTGYALNFIHAYIHEFDYAYSGKSSTGWDIFRKPQITFTLNGKTHVIDPSTMLVKTDAAGLTTFKIVTETSNYVTRINRQPVTYTADQVASMLNITKQVLWERDADYFFATNRNPETHICNTFALVNESSGTYTATLYVNLTKTPMSAYNQKFTSYGVKNTMSKFQWLVYNDCTASTASASAGFAAGNSGLCSIAVQPNTTPFTPTYDLSRQFATLEGQFVEQAGGGKEYITHCYFNIKGCGVDDPEGDDPCGQSQRLPRRKVNN